jgi:hypothetical protein
MILAVGYRIRSPRGTEFFQRAIRHLAEYLLKGFLMDDERLKNPGGGDYFDELLERIREIRASEKRFHQKVRDLFALSDDYANDPREVNRFFAEVQNKLLYAVTHYTFECCNLNPQKLELLLHKFFGKVCLEVDVFDRAGKRSTPREWFIAPLPIIDEAIELIISGGIVNYRYDDKSRVILLHS